MTTSLPDVAFHDTYPTPAAGNYLKDLPTLIQEIEQNLFIPIRFRKAPFEGWVKASYLGYLRKELAFYENKYRKTMDGHQSINLPSRENVQ